MLTIRYWCHFGRVTGYGRAAHDYLLALRRHADVRLDIQPLGDPQHLEPRYAELQPDVQADFDDAEIDVDVVHSWPGDLGHLADVGTGRPAGTTPTALTAPRVAITTWETDPLPPPHAAALDLYDAVIVPSMFCCALLVGAVAAALPIFVVPHCFDPQFWVPSDNSTPQSPFRFYTIGAWSDRKNPLGVLKAYLAGFSRDDAVHLAIVVGEQVDPWQAIHATVAASGLSTDEVPSFSCHHDRISEQDLYELHAGGDCFVSATRGEGWGLGAFEAAIMQKPVVMPGWGGQQDFLDGYASWFRVPHTYAPCVPDGHLRPLPGGGFGVTKSSGLTCRQRWAEPDLLAMGTAMRRVYERSATVVTDDQRDRLELEHRFGYETIGPELAALLHKVIQSPRIRTEE